MRTRKVWTTSSYWKLNENELKDLFKINTTTRARPQFSAHSNSIMTTLEMNSSVSGTMDSRTSSGFISADNNNNITTSTDNTSESSVPTLSSFKEFIQHHVHPTDKEYSIFATSYLCPEMPLGRILCEDSDSYKDLDLEFPTLVPIQSYKVQQDARRLMGESIRRKFIIPSSKLILNDLKCTKFTKEEKEERWKYLYAKAKQWCEVDKALSMDSKYPRPHPHTIRKLYSTAHQKAVKVARKSVLRRSKGPISSPIQVFNITDRIIEDIRSLLKVHISYDPGQKLDQGQRDKWEQWESSVNKVFEDITPLGELQTKETHWQQRALSTHDKKTTKGNTKRFWRRNVYPPKSLEDYIAEKRNLLPPLKPEYLQTDYLSGIWDPVLMTEGFEITPPCFDSRLEQVEGPDPISWWVVHEATQKCWKWLHTIPANL